MNRSEVTPLKEKLLATKPTFSQDDIHRKTNFETYKAQGLAVIQRWEDADILMRKLERDMDEVIGNLQLRCKIDVEVRAAKKPLPTEPKDPALLGSNRSGMNHGVASDPAKTEGGGESGLAGKDKEEPKKEEEKKPEETKKDGGSKIV